MQYFYAVNGNRLGPSDEATLAGLLQTGVISANTLVWCEGMDAWAPLGTVLPQIVPDAPTIPTPVPVPPPAAASHVAPPAYVGFWARVGGAIIDNIVTQAVSMIGGVILGAVIGGIMGGAGATMEDISIVCQLAGFIFGLLIDWLYHAIMESSSCQGTLGKMAIGAKVVNASGNRISFAQATGRHFGKIISALFFCIGYMMVGWDERKQGLHDKMAGTFVVRK